MPRGGSKKGEHRGSAKRAAKRSTGRGFHRPKGSPNKMTLEVENEIARIVNPNTMSNLFPKEQMLIAMREMMTEFADWKATETLELATTPLTDDCVRRAAFARARAREALIIATDFSYKAAPYLHPRLAALAVVPGANDNPRDIVQAMLDEIDQRSRNAKLINGSGNGQLVEDEEDAA